MNMKRLRNYFLPAVVLLVLMFLVARLAAEMRVFSSPCIEGVIVDAESGEPLEGVVVTASWMLIPEAWTSVPIKTLHAAETVTDHLGQYVIPGWGPKSEPHGMLRDEPNIRFFKPGYMPLVIKNNSVYHPGLEGDTEHKIKEHVTHHDGSTGTYMYEPEEHQVKLGEKLHTFKLERFEGTDAEYAKLLRDKYVGSLRDMTGGRTCEWKQLPITFTTLHKLTISLQLPKHIPLYLVSYLGGQDRCGSAEEYFKEYLE